MYFEVPAQTYYEFLEKPATLGKEYAVQIYHIMKEFATFDGNAQPGNSEAVRESRS